MEVHNNIKPNTVKPKIGALLMIGNVLYLVCEHEELVDIKTGIYHDDDLRATEYKDVSNEYVLYKKM
jgi:hypothetical protein